tara:strand:- start:156 stop:278 length:123 start_codon:yes stop_codon:yes gene_type:complete
MVELLIQVVHPLVMILLVVAVVQELQVQVVVLFALVVVME